MVVIEVKWAIVSALAIRNENAPCGCDSNRAAARPPQQWVDLGSGGLFSARSQERFVYWKSKAITAPKLQSLPIQAGLGQRRIARAVFPSSHSLSLSDNRFAPRRQNSVSAYV